METLINLSRKFFDMFDFESNINECSINDKACLERVLLQFLESGKKEDAFEVYFCICEIFKFFGTGYENTKKLLELLSDHEYHSGELLTKHRDHYSHSIYVFALGLAIYANDVAFRNKFIEFYHMPYNKESNIIFLKLWGLIALFYDIGYPFQLAHEQIKEYVKELYGEEDNIFVSFGNVDKFLFISDDNKKILDQTFECTSPIKNINDLLAYGLELRLGYNRKAVSEILLQRVVKQKKFIDHGYFSSVLLARQLFNAKALFSIQLLDVLTTILLHNNFNKYDAPNKRPINITEHPMAYLLILCDELQCWDRMAYGKVSKRDPLAWDINLKISENNIIAKYIFDTSVLPEDKNKNITNIKNGDFKKNIIGTDNENGYITSQLNLNVDYKIQKKLKKAKTFISDDRFINLYDIAKAIHISYNEHCKYFDESRIDEDFGLLPLEFKISNIEVAKSYSYKLELINCFYSSKSLDYDIVTDFRELKINNISDVVGFLCREEHVRWVKEKLSLGWEYGTDYTNTTERNQKKIHKDIVPYDILTEEEQSKDELMINNMFNLLPKFESNIKIYNYVSMSKPEIVIAGTGHRYFLSDKKELKVKIKHILKEYQKNYRIVVYTCFAYGADQLIAECASELDITLKAVLPMEYEDYINDVKNDALLNGISYTQEDENRMRRLLAQTVVCKVINDSKYKYAKANEYMVKKCNVLLALWDEIKIPLADNYGNPINKGGTYDCIEEAIKAGKTIKIVNCFR